MLGDAASYGHREPAAFFDYVKDLGAAELKLLLQDVSGTHAVDLGFRGSLGGGEPKGRVQAKRISLTLETYVIKQPLGAEPDHRLKPLWGARLSHFPSPFV